MTPELEVVDLVEAAIIADLQLDSLLALYVRGHDFAGMKGGDDPSDPTIDERLYTITVSAEDRGTFNGYAGISIVAVTIEIQRNLADQDPNGLSKLASLIDCRLPATQLADQSRHQAFSNNRLKVFGIMPITETETRSDQDLTRERTIARQFLCAQIA